MDNIHRFKDDPDWGRFLHRFWSDDLSILDRKYVNERDWRTHKLTLPDNIFDLNYAFACAVNAERCSIHGVQFRRHVKNTLPLVETDHEPPTHTVIIEANIHATGTSGKKITRSMRHRIIQSCGDSGLRRGRSTCIDPALCLYTGCRVMCILDNVGLTESVPRGNGTVCTVVGMKLKEQCDSFKWKNYFGRKVWTVNAKDVEYIELQKYPKSKEIEVLEMRLVELENCLLDTNLPDQNSVERSIEQVKHQLKRERSKYIFQLTPSKMTCRLNNFKPSKFYDDSNEEPFKPFPLLVEQFLINLNTASTGHKLQGLSKDVLIITSWPKQQTNNWEYVVISRVRTRSGLFLLQPLSMEKNFGPSQELKRFFKVAREKESLFLEKRKRMLSKLQESLNLD